MAVGTPRPVHVAADDSRESIQELLRGLVDHSAALVRGEVALARQEMRESLAALRSGLLVTTAGALVASLALLTFCAAAILGLAHLMDPGLAALVVAVVLALGAGSAVRAGLRRLRNASLTPRQTLETLKEDKQWLKQEMR